MVDVFSPAERAALYRVIESRRDVRAFRTDPIATDTLARILGAAHHAPSVGLMQAWNFIVIRDAATKARVKALFEVQNELAVANYAGARADLYRSLKLEGIEEAPINLCVTCDRTRSSPHVLGRHTVTDTDVYSTCCAIQNLWLAARVEGIGVGWVSILDYDDLRPIFGIPETVLPVAYLCVGYPRAFFGEPELQRRGSATQLPMNQIIFEDRWGNPPIETRGGP